MSDEHQIAVIRTKGVGDPSSKEYCCRLNLAHHLYTQELLDIITMSFIYSRIPAIS